MEKEKKYFLAQDAVLDGDSSPFAVSPNSWVNSENIRVRSTDKGGVGAVECIGGTLMLSSPQPSINFITIGKAVDDENNRFCYFKYCTSGPWHKISCWDVVAQTEYDVLLSSQVTGYLGFDKDNPIHSAKVIGGLLYWTDNLNQPRRINIDAGIKMNHPSYVTDAVAYVAPLQQWIITVIRRAAYYPPNVTKKEDAGFDNNFLVNDATQYATRYIYRDFEYSVIGPYSVLMPYNDLIQVENYVEVKIPTNEFIDQDILEVELIVRFGNNSSPFVIHTWNRTDIDAHNSGTALQFDFYNDITGSPVDQVAAAKPFDSVPRLAETIELAKNRSFFANVLEGYDTPSVSSLSATSNTVEDGATTLIGTWGFMWILVTIKDYDGSGNLIDTYSVTRGLNYLESPESSPPYYYFGTFVTHQRLTLLQRYIQQLH